MAAANLDTAEPHEPRILLLHAKELFVHLVELHFVAPTDERRALKEEYETAPRPHLQIVLSSAPNPVPSSSHWQHTFSPSCVYTCVAFRFDSVRNHIFRRIPGLFVRRTSQRKQREMTWIIGHIVYRMTTVLFKTAFEWTNDLCWAA